MNYKIMYNKGLDNRAVDALSRNPSHHDDDTIQSSNCFVVSTIQPKWLEEVVHIYDSDSYVSDIIAKLLLDSSSMHDFVWHQGLLKHKGRIWIGNDLVLQQRLISAVHCSVVGGHSGVLVTYRKLKQMFAWKGLKTSVVQFVQSCVVCQQDKPDRTKLPGLLQPMHVPEGACQLISLDFVEGLPVFGSANCILVVVDKFTKYGHFIPLKHPFTATVVAKLFFYNIYKLHGMPSSIISDRGSVFTSALWRELFSLIDVQLCMSYTYHPQIDGQIEHLNQCLRNIFSMFCRWLS
jgi:hypothetical protein